ncbi:MAG: phosphoribosylglycinamide formyltransferase [Alphaproteobacteria bacterium]|nr:phosphoribosylglycinamide formyltransferase [Alphaproteobacteria bacterium]MCB9698251.1 phosphoribosylglycinamide formyltransferase [Alphaproteobacteria bacterium]
MSQARVPVGVLASGSGTNLQALLDAAATDDFPARIVVVGSDRPGALALQRAEGMGVPTFTVRRKGHASREDFDAAVAHQLLAHGVRWVCLAGYMRIVGPTFLDAFEGRVLNIHPSLLPAFPGLDAQRQAFEHGVKVAGCTVHLVDAGTDTGPIVAQEAVPVLDGDDAEALRLRILAAEHRIYPRALAWAVADKLRIEGRKVRIDEEGR